MYQLGSNILKKSKILRDIWTMNGYMINNFRKSAPDPLWQTMQDKTAHFRVGWNSHFWKRDKIAKFDNKTKPPILKWEKTAFLYWYKSLLLAKLKVDQDKLS